MHNYWLGVMAVAFVLALGTWLLLVFNADRHPAHGRPQESLPHREVIGGEFEARDGGRQLMPIPGVPAQAGPADRAQAGPAVAGRAGAESASAEPVEPGQAGMRGVGAQPFPRRLQLRSPSRPPT